MKILKNLRNDLVRLRNASSEKMGYLRNKPSTGKTPLFLIFRYWVYQKYQQILKNKQSEIHSIPFLKNCPRTPRTDSFFPDLRGTVNCFPQFLDSSESENLQGIAIPSISRLNLKISKIRLLFLGDGVALGFSNPLEKNTNNFE